MGSRTHLISGLSALILGTLILQSPASAARIAVIGTGNVGAALGPEFAAQGHTIVYGSREPNREDVQALVARTTGDASATQPQQAVTGADMVVLAVPGTAAVDIAASLGDLSGKILIDPTNVVSRENGRMAHGVPGKG